MYLLAVGLVHYPYMKNIGIIIVLILVAVGGWWLYTGGDATTSPEGTETVSTTSDSIVGSWKSVEDANFTRTLYENGQYKDAYEGQPSADMSGPWVTFTSATVPEGFAYPVEEGATYLQLDSGADALYFKVTKVTDTDLELIYLNRGGALTFTRI